MALQLIRLKSGEDIITNVLKEDEYGVKIENPVVLVPMGDGKGNKVQMGMVPWIPFSNDPEFTISHDWIVLLAVPNDEITDNWERIYGPGIIKPTTKILYS